MKRIRQTIEVSEPLWRALELMSRDMGVDRDALVAQALFQLARQNGYVAPTVVPLHGEALPDAGASEPGGQVHAPVAASLQVAATRVVERSAPVASAPGAAPVAVAPTPGASAAKAVPVEAVSQFSADGQAGGAAADEAEGASLDSATDVAAASAEDAVEEPVTEPPGGATASPVTVPEISPEQVRARMQELLEAVEASVVPSEGLGADSSEDSDDDDSDDDDSDDEDSDDNDSDDSDSDERDSDDEDSDDNDADEDADESDSDDEDSDGDDADDATLAEDASDDVSDDDVEDADEPSAKRDVSDVDLEAELAALGVVDPPTDAAQAQAPTATPVAARPLVPRPVQKKVRPADEAVTLSADHAAETTNVVRAPAPLEVFIRWAQGTPVAISTERFTIGRGPRCSLVVRSERVSREHAVVTRVGDEVFIEDLNSSNGTWFNNERISKQQVSDGDEYMLGTEAVSFTMRPAEE